MAMLVSSLANGYYAKPLAGKPSTISLTKFSRRSPLTVPRAQATPINPSIRKEEAKVVDNVPVAELSKPLTAYCSAFNLGAGDLVHFLFVMGSHVKHNKETGDNVGPLLLKK